MSSRCAVCGYDNAESLASIPNNKNVFLCNCNDPHKSHIVYFLQHSANKELILHPNNPFSAVKFWCSRCQDNNIFQLCFQYNKDGSPFHNFNFLCAKCLSPNESHMYIPIVSNGIVNPIFLSSPINPHPVSGAQAKKKINEEILRPNHSPKPNIVIPQHLLVYPSFLLYQENLKKYVELENEYQYTRCRNESFKVHLETFSQGKYIFKTEASIIGKMYIGCNFYVNVGKRSELKFKVKKLPHPEVNPELGRTKFIAKLENHEIYASELTKIIGANGFLTIKFKVSPIEYRRKLIAIQYSNSIPPIIQDVLMCKINQSFYQNNRLRNIIPLCMIKNNENLNRSQKNAINFAHEYHFVSIQGPPGTGKTDVAARMAYSFIKAGLRVFIGSKTNAATNVLTRKLISLGLNPFRILGLTYYNNCPDDILIQSCPPPSDKKMKKLHLPKIKKLSNQNYKFHEKDLKKCNLICSTLCCSGKLNNLKNKFDVVIVDEAGQALDDDLLIPITNSNGHVILFGDHVQLLPYVGRGRLRSVGYDKSLLHRSHEAKLEPLMLNVQYRMHPCIGNFISKEFYDNKLQNGVGRNERIAIFQSSPFPNPAFPLLFWHMEFTEMSQDSSFMNPEQTYYAEKLVDNLILNGINGKRIMIISPYIGEFNFLNSRIEQHVNEIPPRFAEEWRQVTIFTIDASQGHESDFVIVITVRSNQNHEVGFLKDPHRNVVALSRARFGLFVIGNCETIKYNQNWQNYIRYCSDNSSLVRGEIGSFEIHRFVPVKPINNQNDDFQDVTRDEAEKPIDL